MSDDKNAPKATVLMSPAFLKPVEEKDHYGLFRSMVIRRDDGTDQVVEPPVGPLMIFRKCAKDEKEDMWTFDEVSKERIGLKKVWDARQPEVYT